MSSNRTHQYFRRRPSVTDAPILPRRFGLPFAGFYTYSPKGESEVSKRSRQLCGRIKNGTPSWLKAYSTRVQRELTDNRRFGGFIHADALLIPVPECGAGARASRWVARRLAITLHQLGLGNEVWHGLRRIQSVERSSAAWLWERPTVQQHYQSMAVIAPPTPPSQIVLIDDVVTKGRTLLAAAIRLSEAIPSATIRAFALVRTMGLIPDVDRLFDPCLGEIRWDGRDAHRDP